MTREERDALVLTHLPLVNSVAGAMRRRLAHYVLTEDLIGAGRLGLVEAAERYDASRGVTFGAFARIRIAGAMLDYCRQFDILSRRARAAYRNDGMVGSVEVSLDDHDIPLTTTPWAEADRCIEARQLIERSMMPAREYVILVWSFWYDATLDDIGARLSISQARVSQLKTRALTRLSRAA